MGNANYTCIEDALEEQCTTLETGEKVSFDIFVKFQTKTRLAGASIPLLGEDKSLLSLRLFLSPVSFHFPFLLSLQLGVYGSA